MRKLLIAAVLLMTLTAARAEERRPVVVELFTSQGCSSCPPADAFLGELAARPDVLALSLHVDYWDYIGWKDPFAQRAHTERQRAYAKTLHLRFVYTPQIVIDGMLQGIGSERAKIDKLIEKARKSAAAGPALTVSGDGERRTLRIAGDQQPAPATIWLVGFNSRHETSVGAGENGGRRIANHNVVRVMHAVGTWSGGTAEVPLDLRPVRSKCEKAAVIVQAEETGPVLTAARVELPALHK
jgi:hypothetical protein